MFTIYQLVCSDIIQLSYVFFGGGAGYLRVAMSLIRSDQLVIWGCQPRKPRMAGNFEPLQQRSSLVSNFGQM